MQKPDIYKHVGKKLLELSIDVEPLRLIVDKKCVDQEFARRLQTKIRSAIDSFLVHRLIVEVLDSGLVSVEVAPAPSTRVIKPADEEHNLIEQDTVDPELPWYDEI